MGGLGLNLKLLRSCVKTRRPRPPRTWEELKGIRPLKALTDVLLHAAIEPQTSGSSGRFGKRRKTQGGRKSRVVGFWDWPFRTSLSGLAFKDPQGLFGMKGVRLAPGCARGQRREFCAGVKVTTEQKWRLGFWTWLWVHRIPHSQKRLGLAILDSGSRTGLGFCASATTRLQFHYNWASFRVSKDARNHKHVPYVIQKELEYVETRT